MRGIRGRIARTIPDQIVRKYLTRATRVRGVSDTSTENVRRENQHAATALADSLGLHYVYVPSSSMFCIQEDDWHVLKGKFGQFGLLVEQLHDQQSYASETTWSVSKNSRLPDSHAADLRGLGALWQVFPGPIDPPMDAQDFVGEVDAVYTWVDSTDPKWARGYRQTLGSSNSGFSSSATDIARFTSRDELLYSLRSLEMNLPWIDRVYIVTSGQRPEWLLEYHPKLVLIDHDEIFKCPQDNLPTFNSHAIESQLANIPGLKEHFIYVNDDVFFARYLHPNTFFGPAGQAKYCLSPGHFASAQDDKLPINRAAANNRSVVVSEFGRTTSRKFQHVAHPQRLAVLREILRRQPHSVDRVAGARFRSDSDISIPSSLAHQFAARMGLGYPSKVHYQYVDIGSNLFSLEMLRLVRSSDLDMFCINEVLSTEDQEQRSATVQMLLQSKFPIKSSFEK